MSLYSQWAHSAAIAETILRQPRPGAIAPEPVLAQPSGSWLRCLAGIALAGQTEAATPTEDPRARAAVRNLYALLDALDDRDRMAFVLRFAEGYELTEVATALGCSLATAKRSIARAEGYVLTHARNDERLRDYVANDDVSSSDGGTP